MTPVTADRGPDSRRGHPRAARADPLAGRPAERSPRESAQGEQPGGVAEDLEPGARTDALQQHMSGWFADGGIVYDETIVDGIENTVDAFLSMMRGANTGKMLVRI